MIAYVVNPFPEAGVLDDFWRRAWGGPPLDNYDQVLKRSLAHLGAMDGGRLIGFVNIAWDGGVHAFILDTAVDVAYRRRGIASELVRRGAELARGQQMQWLHVDFEPHLEGFYRACGFGPTAAGLMRLSP
ncbi:ribosomal protein S18 acetylase RimI-like enzyme [Devosia subaequoris]|uniref:Ribosomal protein S18 acetylase RimI-like enzyme n=1 Tax=Devosia subaequoris TaxID=395930 RepID=A0A7W6ILH8_9HYPH|nr:GNAT family N-acetyltransferase [Devosia subaequoris]MBB4051813.1 ribosomal protein S18 acetylase RimI-like enzyme [Devosia subaequoris]MCP1210971.1 GNAT family N-acetyltransferase [Devosia subaequoris]